LGDQSLTGISLDRLRQVCVVVKDIETTVNNYQKSLGIDSWQIRTIDSSRMSEMTYHGKPTDYVFKVGTALVGLLEIELIQHVSGDTIYRDFVLEKGEGLHHLGHVKVDDLNKAIEKFENDGFSCVQSGRFPGGGYAYMNATEKLGTIIELIQRSDN
jgi:hypothetical protein